MRHVSLIWSVVLSLVLWLQASFAEPVLQLDGTASSFLQYPSWTYFFSKSNPNRQFETQPPTDLLSEVSVSLEFRCAPENDPISGGSRQCDGLLLYTDDERGIGGTFLEIKLLPDSHLRVRIDDNSEVRTRNVIELRQAINFTDGQWHRLELIRNLEPENHPASSEYSLAEEDEHFEAITLKVDLETIHKKIVLSSSTMPSVLHGECRHRGKALFIGGIPDDYRQHSLSHLALPTIAYELHFRGGIRNVYYAFRPRGEQAVMQMQSPVGSYGLLDADEPSKVRDECADQQPRCEHGGYCYSTKNGAVCDCSPTDFEGTYCQNEKRLLEATFRGTLGEYLGHNHVELPNAWSLLSSSESFELSFRTKISNGLLLLSSDEEENHLAIVIREAALTLTMKIGASVHEKTINPSKVRFDDNQWHSVLVWRKIREISPSTYFCHFSITVDGIYTQYGSTAGLAPYLVSKIIYVGGSGHNSAVEAKIPTYLRNSFVGCLRRVIFTADNIRLNLLELLQSSHLNQARQSSGDMNSGLIRFFGNHSSHRASSLMMCEEVDVSDPITFTTSESYLKLPGWNSPKEGTISFKFRTNEANGVLMYSAANGVETGNYTGVDYFALELLDGHIYLLLNLGSSAFKVKASGRRVDDSHWHTVTVTRIGRTGQVVVDEDTSEFVSPGTSHHLDLADAIYLGGVPHFTGAKRTFTPPELWSGSMGFGYIGCVRDLFLNDRIVDISSIAKRQDSGSVKPSCHSGPAQCQVSPCQNGGVCTEGWNRYWCDCSHTAYTGSACTKNAATVGFNGEQYVTIILPEELQTQSESVHLRFRTTKPNGLLLTTSHGVLNHHLTMLLDSGSVRLDMNYGEGHQEHLIVLGSNLNDDKWHTIHMERRGPSLEVTFDKGPKKMIELTGQHFTLHIGAIHLGARLNLHKASHKKHLSSFVGYMQNFIFNGQAYFEKARDGQFSNGSIRMTAKLGKKDRVLHNAVTFKSKYTFVGLPQLKAYSHLNIYLQFKTREANGLIFFNGGGQRHDFIALELVNGHLHYIFDLGDGPRRLQSNTRTSLSDNRWHTVTLGRPSLHQHTMLLDDSLMTTSTNSGSERNLHLDLDGLLYFGGVRDTMWQTLPKAIKSRVGFEGCIASLDLNGETFNLVGPEVLIPSSLVESGCSAPITRCSSTACANRGVCVQLWNSFTCDCDLTTFSGPTCADGNESTAYQFGPNPGLISFTFEENNRPDTRNDLLALGFLTTNKNGALVRVDSATTADYLQLEVIDGNVLVVYNLGTEDIDIGDLGIKVNDGKYHIVRFTRSGQNSTLQIDNHNVITRSPGGKQLNIFNRHAAMQIGGHKNVLRGTIEKPFIGIIAGLVFNGHRLLDMAAEDDPRTKIEGDVELMISIGNQQSMLTTPSSTKLNNQMLSEPKSPSYGDDLISSVAGSGCFDVNDDEECARIANEGSGDDLITPVYTVTRSNVYRPTTPASTYHRGGGYGRPCQNEDDDDCVEGSGDAPPPPPPPSVYESYYTSSTSAPYWTTWTPPTVAPILRPPLSNIPNHNYYTPPTFYYGNNHDPYGTGYALRPKTTAPSWTKPVYSVSGPTRPIIHPPIEPQGPPEIYDVPLNIPEIINQTTVAPVVPEVLSRSSHDRTVIIISMIAICLIAVVIIAPIVLFFKVRLRSNDPAAYKVESFGVPKMSASMPHHGAGYNPYNPVVRATSVSGITGMMPPGINSLPGRGTRPGTPTERKKDPHEWYV